MRGREEHRAALVEHLTEVVEETARFSRHRSWRGESKKTQWRQRRRARLAGVKVLEARSGQVALVARSASHIAGGAAGPRQVGLIPGYTLYQTYRVHNQQLVERFNEFARRIGNVRDLWHGTSILTALQIVEEGLRPGNPYCMFGSGIYLGPFAKAVGYAGHGPIIFMLKVRAALGRIWYATKPAHCNWVTLIAEGLHSIAGMRGVTASWGKTLREDEFVVYRTEQVLVTEIWEFRQTQELVSRV